MGEGERYLFLVRRLPQVLISCMSVLRQSTSALCCGFSLFLFYFYFFIVIVIIIGIIIIIIFYSSPHPIPITPKGTRACDLPQRSAHSNLVLIYQLPWLTFNDLF